MKEPIQLAKRDHEVVAIDRPVETSALTAYLQLRRRPANAENEIHLLDYCVRFANASGSYSQVSSS